MERNVFVLMQKEVRGIKDEQYAQSTYGSEKKGERRRMGAKAAVGLIKNEATPHFSPLRLCPCETFALWNHI